MGKKEDMVVNGGLSTTPKTRQAALYYVSVFILWNQRNKCSLCLKQRDKRRVKKPRSERTKIKLNFAGFAIVPFQRLLKFIQSGTWRCSRVPAGIRWSYGGEPRCGWYKGTFKNSKASLPPTVASSKAVTANSIVVEECGQPGVHLQPGGDPEHQETERSSGKSCLDWIIQNLAGS